MLDKSPEQPMTRSQERKKGKKGLLIGIGAGATALAAGVALTVGLNAGPKEDNEPPVTGPVPTETSEPSPEVPQEPAEGEFIVSLEELSEMSSEQLTEATRISVESVTVDGKIDWVKVAEEVTKRDMLLLNAGLTPSEMENVYLNYLDPIQFNIDKYRSSLEAGYYLPESQDPVGLHVIQVNTLQTGYIEYLETNQTTVRSTLELEDATVDASSESSATVTYSSRLTDTFFSSGALDTSMEDVIANLGRSEDANTVLTTTRNFVVQNGYVYVG